MFRNPTTETTGFSPEAKCMNEALAFTAIALINYLDEQHPAMQFQKCGFNESNIYSFEQDNQEPHSPCYIISIKVGLLHTHFFDYFSKQCKLNMQYVLSGFLVSERDLVDAKISMEQYGKFIGGFDALLAAEKKQKQVEHKSYESALRFK